MKSKNLLLILVLALIFAPMSAKTEALSSSGELIKGESFSAVYYKAIDGKRYVFPNQRIYNSWYADFLTVNVITDGELFDISLGGNVFYKPDSRLVKITTDPKVYWVDEFGILRHVASEGAAQSLFGSNWVEQIDDLPDEFFSGYIIGSSIDSDFSIEVYNDWTIDDNKELTERGANQAEQEATEEEEEEEPEEVVDEGQQPESINLTALISNRDAELTWFVTGGNTNYGFIVLKSEDENPTYPEDEYIKLVDGTTRAYTWQDLLEGSAWYFRVCRLNSDGSCGTYSDSESLSFGVSGKTSSMTLTGQVVDGVAKLSWDTHWLSPDDGFYLSRDVNENPKYPANIYIWFGKNIESYDWQGLSIGTYYFRICNYINSTHNLCEYYSDNLELTIE